LIFPAAWSKIAEGEQMAKLSAMKYGPEHLKSASELTSARHLPKFASLSVPAFHSVLERGMPRGILAEICGRRSSGRTAGCLHVLAQATCRGEICAIVDLYDSFHPASAQAAGVVLERLVWVRCQANGEHAMRAADLLLHAGGFGVVLLDLCEAPPRILNRIPVSYWHRFRRAVEHTPTILLLCAESTQANSCAAISLRFQPRRSRWSGQSRFLLLRGIESSIISERHEKGRGRVLPIRPETAAVRLHPRFELIEK
jgi:hypothetical protein